MFEGDTAEWGNALRELNSLETVKRGLWSGKNDIREIIRMKLLLFFIPWLGVGA